MKRYVFGCVAWMMLALTPLVAQDYPTKPVRIVVGFAAGSVSDIVARLVAQKLEASLGKPFVVEVRPGAGSNVAAQHVVRSAKDGYTLFVATSSSTIRSPTAGFDFSTDLAPVALISSVPFVLAAYPGLGAKTVRDFIAMAKSKPRELTFGGSGVGTTGYLVAQLFNQRAGTDLAIAPYPSTVQATTDLMTGRISVAFASVSNVVQLIETGKLTALAMAQPTRSALLPDTPTIDEAGLPGVHASIWIGMLVPVGTPRAIVETLSKVINEANGPSRSAGGKRATAQLRSFAPSCLTGYSAPIPKFASFRGEFDCELRNQRSTSNSMVLVRL